MKPSYEVRIIPADNGVIATVGCKTLVFQRANYDDFFKLLKRYLSEPTEDLQRELFPDENEATTLVRHTHSTRPEQCDSVARVARR